MVSGSSGLEFVVPYTKELVVHHVELIELNLAVECFGNRPTRSHQLGFPSIQQVRVSQAQIVGNAADRISVDLHLNRLLLEFTDKNATNVLVFFSSCWPW